MINIFISVPYFFIMLIFFYQKRTFYLTYKTLKFTLKHFFTVTPICFGPCRPSSGSLYWAWLKLLFCRYNQWKYVVIINAVLWQHVFQVVVYMRRGLQSETQVSLCTPLSTHTTTCNFGQAQYRLPDDGPHGPKHVGVTVKKCFNVNFNIQYFIC